jgi:hypothetical protein
MPVTGRTNRSYRTLHIVVLSVIIVTRSAQAATCSGNQYSYNSSSCSTCPADSSLISNTLGCTPSLLLSSGGPSDTSFYLSCSQAEGVDAFATVINASSGGIQFSSDAAVFYPNSALVLSSSSSLSSPLLTSLPTGDSPFSISAWIFCKESSLTDATPSSIAIAWGSIGISTSPNASSLAVTSAGRIDSPNVNVTSIFGSGASGGFNDGVGTNALFDIPIGASVDSIGNIYIADSNNHRIRKIDIISGNVSTLAGDGTSGFFDGNANNSKFNNSAGAAVDNIGNIYIADGGNHRIRLINVSTGTVSTVAGDGNTGTSDGIGTNANFNDPYGIFLDSSGDIYVGDRGNHLIRKISIATGQVSTVAGSGTVGFADATGTNAMFSFPSGITADSSVYIYVVDTNNHCIRNISATGVVSTLAGNGTAGFTDGTGASAQFNYPSDIALDGSGNAYISDTNNHRIRKINIATGLVSTLAGTGVNGFSDGIGASAAFNSPKGILVFRGTIFVSDSMNHRIRKLLLLPSSLPGPIPICDSIWHHVALTSDGGALARISSYVDGNLFYSSTNTYSVGSDGVSSLRIGFNGDTQTSSLGGEFFSGSLSDLRIYNRTISFSEIGLLSQPRLYFLNSVSTTAVVGATSYSIQCEANYYGSLGLTRLADGTWAFTNSSSTSCTACAAGSLSVAGSISCSDPTPSPSPSASATVTSSQTSSVSSSASTSVTPSPSSSDIATSSATTAPTISPSASASGSPSVTASPSFSPISSSSPLMSFSSTASPSVTEYPSTSSFPSMSSEPTSSPSGSSSGSPSVTETTSPSVTSSVSPSASASVTMSPSVTPTLSPSVTSSASQSVTETASPSVTTTSSPSASQSITTSASPSSTGSISASASVSTSGTLSPTVSVSSSASVSPSASSHPSYSPTMSSTASPSASGWNHEPVVSLRNTSFVYTEGQNASLFPFADISIFDSETNPILNLTVRIVSGCDKDDILESVEANTPEFTGIWTSGWIPKGGYSSLDLPECTLFLYGTSFQNTANTLTKWISLLSLIRFRNPSLNPSGATRSLQIRGFDNPIGTPFSDTPKIFASGIVYISFRRVNNAPSITAGPAAEWIDPGPFVFVAPEFTVFDVESRIKEINVTISANCYINDDIVVNASLLTPSASSSISASTFSSCSIQLRANSTEEFASPEDFSAFVRALQFRTFLSPKAQRSLAMQPRELTFTVLDIAPVGESLTNLTASVSSSLSIIPFDVAPILNGTVNTTLIFDASLGTGVSFSSLGSLFITDVDSYSLSSAEIKIISKCGEGDTLSYSSSTATSLNNGTFPLVTFFRPTSCSMKFSGIDTLEAYAAVIQSVSFNNFFSSPGNGTRSISISLTQYSPLIANVKTVLNGNSTTIAFVFELIFKDVNTAPVINVGSRLPLHYAQLSPPEEVCSGAYISDAQGDVIQQLTVRISSGCNFGDELSHHVNDLPSLGIEALPYIQYASLTAVSKADLTFSDGAGSNCSLTFVGAASLSAYSEVVSHITFSNLYTDLVAGIRTLTISVTDLCSPKTGSMKNLTGTANTTVVVEKIQKPPLIETTSVCSVQYIEGITQLIDANVNVVDLESLDRVFNASVTVSSGCTVGDILSLSSIGQTILSSEGINSAYNSSSCTLVFSTSASTGMSTNVTGFLFRNVMFSNSRSDLQALPVRLVTFSASTGSGPSEALLSATASTLVTTYPINNPPIMLCDSNISQYVELSPPLLFESGLSLSDLESDFISSASIIISENCTSGDHLSLLNVNLTALGIEVSGFYSQTYNYNSITSKGCGMFLSGVASTVSYATALKQVSFSSTSISSKNSRRKITLAVSDIPTTGSNGAQSTTCSTFLDFVLINSAPSINASITVVTTKERASPIVIDPYIEISDPEDDFIQSATVQIITGCSAGDMLIYSGSLLMATPNASYISASYDASPFAFTSCTLNLVAQPPQSTEVFASELRRVQFSNSLVNANSLLRRTISFSVSDSPRTGTNGVRLGFVNISLDLISINKAPTLNALLSYTFNEKEYENALDSNVNAIVEQKDSIFVTDWDLIDSDCHSISITSLSPQDGDLKLLRGLNASQIFHAQRTISSFSPAVNSPRMEKFTLLVRPGVLLSTILAKTFFLRLIANEMCRVSSDSLSSNAFDVAVYVRRDNANVSWPTSIYGSLGSDSSTGLQSISLSVNENSPIGTLITSQSQPLAAVDADSNQGFIYSIRSQSGVLPGLFSIKSIQGTDSSYNTWTGTSFSPSRLAHIVVARDALDYETGERNWTLIIRVQDDAQFNNSRLPAVESTFSDIVVKITLTDVADTPLINTVSGQPQEGYSTSGYESVWLFGSGLGVLDGPGSKIVAQYTNGNYTYTSPSCVILERLSSLRCLTSPGVGMRFAWKVTIGDATLGGVSSQFSLNLTSYAPPRVFSFSPADAATLSAASVDYTALGLTNTSLFAPCNNEDTNKVVTAACTQGTRRVALIGVNFPSISIANSSPTALGRVKYGPTGGEYTAIDCKVILDYERILCILAPGVGDSLIWDVLVGWQTSVTPLTSYGIPTITDIIGSDSNTYGMTPVSLLGYNFGRVVDSSLSLSSRSVVVQYEPLIQPDASLFPQLYLTAVNCSIAIDHVQINCLTAPGFHDNFRWKVMIAGQVSPWSTVLTKYGAPTIQSFSPRTLTTAGGEVLKLSGSNFGGYNVAWVNFSGIVLNRSDIVYASNEFLQLPTYPGIGANHMILVRVGNHQQTSTDISFTAPEANSVSWVSGDGITSDLELSIEGINFGACCYCKVFACSVFCTINEIDCKNDPIAYPGAWHRACIPSLCPASSSRSDFVKVVINGITANTTEKAITLLTETTVHFTTDQIDGTVQIIIGGLASNQVSYSLSELQKVAPQLSSLQVLDTIPATGEYTLVNPPTRGGVLMRLTGTNLQSIGTVYVASVVGAIPCPSVYSTSVQKTDTATELYGTTILGANVFDAKKNRTIRFDVSTQYALDPDLSTPGNPVRFAVDPLSQLETIKGEPTWIVRPIICQVVFWYRNPTLTATDGRVDFTMPPGQGPFKVHLYARTTDKNSSKETLQLGSYMQPSVQAILPSHGPTYGVNITIKGMNFSPTKNLSDIIGPYVRDYVFSGVIQKADLSLSYINQVPFQLARGDVLPPRRFCKVFNWTSTEIQCTAPIGVPGTPFQVYVEDDTVIIQSAVTSNNQLFTYDQGVLYQPEVIPHGPTLGRTTITMRGYSLGISSSLDVGKVSVQVFMSAVSGSGFVRDKVTPQSVVVTEHTHDSISFITEYGEGQAVISALFIIPNGYTVSNSRLSPVVITDSYPFSSASIDKALLSGASGFFSSEMKFEYDAPIISSITSLNNPCLGLNGDFTRDSVLLVNKTYAGDGSNRDVCIQTRNFPSTAPFEGDIITIRGINFGNGQTPTISVVFMLKPYKIIDAFNSVEDEDGVIISINCIKTGGLSLWRSDNVMVCQLERPAPMENAVIEIQTAYRKIRSDFDFQWDVRFACPQNMFQTLEGSYCLDCYRGAICVGNNAPPVAQPGFWKTISSEWEENFYLSPSEAGAAPFVPCAFPPACGRNQTCSSPGNIGVMCTECLPGWAGSANSLCEQCVSSDANYLVVGFAVCALLIGGVVLIRSAMGRRSKTTIVAKMLVNYLQLLSALRVYLSALDAPSGITYVISIASLSNYITLNFSAFSCATSFNYYLVFTMYMMIPPGAAIVPGSILLLHAAFKRLLYKKKIDYQKIGRITLSSVGVLLFFTQNTVVVEALRVWNCQIPALGGYLLEYPTTSCYSPQHLLVSRVITPVMLAVYGLGIPAAAIMVLRSIRTSMDKKRTLKYYGFMYDGFDISRGRWGWEALVMIRKITFVSIGIVVRYKQLQVILGLMAMLFWLIVHAQFQPYTPPDRRILDSVSIVDGTRGWDPDLNNLETLSLIGNIAMYFAIMINDYVVLGELPSSFADYVSYGLIGLTAIILLRFAQTLALIQFYNWKANRDIAILEKRRLEMRQGFSVPMNKEDDIKKSSIQNGILVTFQVRQRQQLEKLQKRTKRALDLQRDIVQAGIGVSNRTNLEMLQMLNDYHEAISTGVEVSRMTRSKRSNGESKNDGDDSDSDYEEDAMYQQSRVNISAPAEQRRGLFSLSALSMRGKSLSPTLNQKIKQRKLKELQLLQAKELEDLKAAQLPPEVLERLKRSHDLLTLGIMHRADGKRLRYKSLKNQPEHEQVSDDKFTVDASNGPLLEVLQEWHEEDKDHMLNVNEDDERIFKPFSRNVGLQADPIDDPNFFERSQVWNHKDWMDKQLVPAIRDESGSSDDDSDDKPDNENDHGQPSSPRVREDSSGQSVTDNLRSLADAIFGTSMSNNKGVDTSDFGGVPFRSTGNVKKNPLARAAKVTSGDSRKASGTPTSSGSKSLSKRNVVSPGGVSNFIGGIRVVSNASRLRANSSASRYSPTEVDDIEAPATPISVIGRLKHLATSASNRAASSPPSTSRNTLSGKKSGTQLQQGERVEEVQGQLDFSSFGAPSETSLSKKVNPLAKKKESYDPQPLLSSSVTHPALSDLNMNFEESTVFENPMLMNSRPFLGRANPLSKGRREQQTSEIVTPPSAPISSLQRLQDGKKVGSVTLSLSNVNFENLLADSNLLTLTETSFSRVIASLGGTSPDSVRTIEIKNDLSLTESAIMVRIIFPEAAKEQLQTYLGVNGESEAAKELISSCIPRSAVFRDHLPVIVEKLTFDVITKAHADAVSRAATSANLNRVSNAATTTSSSSSSVTGDDPASVSIALSVNDFSENNTVRSRGSTFESLSSFASEFPSIPPSLASSSLTPSAIAVSIDFQQNAETAAPTRSGLKGLKALKASGSTAPVAPTTNDVAAPQVESPPFLFHETSAGSSALPPKSSLSGLKALKAARK